MQATYESFLNEPTPANYLRVRAQLLQSVLPPTPQEIANLQMFCHAEAWERAAKWAAEISDDWLICPRYHYWRARIAEATSDEEGQYLSQFELQACLTAMLEAGDGSQARPYEVLYACDVPDVLAALNLEAIAQHCAQRDDGTYDVVTCADARELWFHQPLLATQSTSAGSEKPVA